MKAVCLHAYQRSQVTADRKSNVSTNHWLHVDQRTVHMTSAFVGWATGDMTDWERCLKLNILAPMALTRAFAPDMVKRKVCLLHTQSCPLAF